MPCSSHSPLTLLVWAATLGLALLTGCDDPVVDPDTSSVTDTDTVAVAETLADTDTTSGTACCAIASAPSGCMLLGGPASGPVDDSCLQTCDFWCSTNWRIEVIDGCDRWSYDMRSPALDEDEFCLKVTTPGPDASDTSDASDASDAQNADASGDD